MKPSIYSHQKLSRKELQLVTGGNMRRRDFGCPIVSMQATLSVKWFSGRLLCGDFTSDLSLYRLIQ